VTAASSGSSGDRLSTLLVHAGEPRPRIGGAANVPIFQNTVFELPGEPEVSDIIYPRLSNLPNHRALSAKLAALEGGAAATVFASGMAAISTSLLTVLRAGDHLLVQEGVYGGTHGFLMDDLVEFGIDHTFVDAEDPAAWQAALTPTTRAFYTEAISNPMMQVADHRAVIDFARVHGLVTIIDNTFATPVNFRPLSLGYDLSLHSATKYLNGHSDVAAGVALGSADLIARVQHRHDHLGGCLDPHACFLLHRGVKTLELRVRRQNATTLNIARYLAGRSGVARVHYPGLESHPAHARARELFSGFGGMLSFELDGGGPAAARFISRIRLILHAGSLGGLETLVTRPVQISHVGMAPEEQARLGISSGLVRMSVGIEDPEDLIADLDQALGA